MGFTNSTAKGWKSPQVCLLNCQKQCSPPPLKKKNNNKQTKNEAETMSSIEGSKNSGVVPCKTCGQKAGGNRLNNTPMFTIQPYSAFTGEHHKKTNLKDIKGTKTRYQKSKSDKQKAQILCRGSLPPVKYEKTQHINRRSGASPGPLHRGPHRSQDSPGNWQTHRPVPSSRLPDSSCSNRCPLQR